MNTQQAQDLHRLALLSQRINVLTSEPIKWFTADEMLRQLGCHEDDGAFIAAMSPDVALSLLAERAMLLEACKTGLEYVEETRIAYEQNYADHAATKAGWEIIRSDIDAIRAAISQCEGASNATNNYLEGRSAEEITEWIDGKWKV